jgi:Domain of unknown function (DUF1937)
MIYLASPYTHRSSVVRAARFNQMLPILAELAKKRISCYSPIVHWHPVEVDCNLSMSDHELWKWSDIDMMELSIMGLFIKLEGWDQSRGMAHEEAFLRNANKTVVWIYPEELQNWIELNDHLHG